MSRSRRSARRPGRACEDCSTPACSPPTRWTSGAPAPAPGSCSPTRSPRWRRTSCVDAVALAVDLVTELDGDTSYPLAVLDAAARHRQAGRRAQQPGQRDRPRGGRHAARQRHPGAGGHADRAARVPSPARLAGSPASRARPPAAGARAPARTRPGAGSCSDRGPPQTGAAQLALLARVRDRGRPRRAGHRPGEALAAAARIGYPVVLKTDEPGDRPQVGRRRRAARRRHRRRAERRLRRPGRPARARRPGLRDGPRRHRARARHRPRSRARPADRGRRRRRPGRADRRPGGRAAAAHRRSRRPGWWPG